MFKGLFAHSWNLYCTEMKISVHVYLKVQHVGLCNNLHGNITMVKSCTLQVHLIDIYWEFGTLVSVRVFCH